MHENKESKVSMLLNKNKVLNDHLKKIKEETNSSNLQIDYIERNRKSRIFEISRLSFVKNEDLVDLAVKVITKGDTKVGEGNIESTRRMKKNDNNNNIIQGSTLVRYIDKINYMFKDKKILAEANFNSVHANIKKKTSS